MRQSCRSRIASRQQPLSPGIGGGRRCHQLRREREAGSSGRFHKATFSGAANFTEATFSGAAAFDEATFSVRAIFAGATFSAVDFREATFTGARFSGAANFTGTTFTDVDKAMHRAEFRNPEHVIWGSIPPRSPLTGSSPPT
jgi:uncharacterized protein YjbI with pentapeptide repeats